MNEQLIKDLRQYLNSLDHNDKPKNERDRIKSELPYKAETPKNIKYLIENITLKANHRPNLTKSCIEFTALTQSFYPQSLEMIVKNSKTQENSFVEICNITVMGDPQLINFNGASDITQRGTSLYFKKQRDVDFAVFGSSSGQGLGFSLCNPNSFDVDITFIFTGLSDYFHPLGIGSRNHD